MRALIHPEEGRVHPKGAGHSKVRDRQLVQMGRAT